MASVSSVTVIHRHSFATSVSGITDIVFLNSVIQILFDHEHRARLTQITQLPITLHEMWGRFLDHHDMAAVPVERVREAIMQTAYTLTPPYSQEIIKQVLDTHFPLRVPAMASSRGSASSSVGGLSSSAVTISASEHSGVTDVLDEVFDENRDGFHCRFRKRMHTALKQVWDCTVSRDGRSASVAQLPWQQEAYNAAVAEWQRTQVASAYSAGSRANDPPPKASHRLAPFEVTAKLVDGRGSILIVVAEDLEYEFVRQEIEQRAPAWQLQQEGFAGNGGSIAFNHYLFSGVRITLASAHNMGLAAVDRFGEMLDLFKPRYVTTVGCCGGRYDGDARAVPTYIITEAVAVGDDNLFFIQAHASAIETWMDLRLHLRFIGRPDGRFRDPRDVARVVSIGTQAAVEGPALDDLLDAYDANCLDMEVAHLWRTVQLHNVFLRSSRLAEIVVLPAIKGYSDGGDTHERAVDMKNGVRSAAMFVITMVNKIVVRSAPAGVATGL
jgi:hypothetical protein